jgi:hypothetical protein
MKHIRLFENFMANPEVPASNLSKREYWSEYDDMDGVTADYWANDPGYAALETNLGVPLDSIQALNSESDDIEELENAISSLDAANTVRSNQEFVTAWDYFPELGVAVAYGDGGAPDWYFVAKK